MVLCRNSGSKGRNVHPRPLLPATSHRTAWPLKRAWGARAEASQPATARLSPGNKVFLGGERGRAREGEKEAEGGAEPSPCSDSGPCFNPLAQKSSHWEPVRTCPHPCACPSPGDSSVCIVSCTPHPSPQIKMATPAYRRPPSPPG